MRTADDPAARLPGRSAQGRPVALLLPGQGAQHQRMAAGLYGDEPVFTAAMDVVFDELGEGGERLRTDWLSDRPSVPIEHVTRSQPLLFAIDHALGRLVLSWGIRPAALLGHSVGEVAAATLAGIFDVRAATRLMADRVHRLSTGPAGGMVAVAAAAAELEPYLRDGLVVGAINAPRQTILAGPEEPLRRCIADLRRDGFSCRRTPSSSPFHSPVLETVAAGAEPVIAATPMIAPTTVLYSAYTGGPLGPAEATSAAYWARQPVAPVLFWPTLNALLSVGNLLLIEAGPGQSLTSIARRHAAVRTGRSSVVAMLPPGPGDPARDRAAVEAVARAIRAEGLVPATRTRR